MRRSLLLLFVLMLPAFPVKAAPSFTKVEGFAVKTGFRGVVAWQASEPVAAVVKWGTSSGSLNGTALPVADAVDTAGLAIFDVATTGTIYYRVVDQITGVATSTRSFVAKNAYSNVSAGVYTINLLVSLDTQSSPVNAPVDVGLADIAAGIDIMAERIYDALDGYARIGTVLVTDTALNNPANVPAYGVCRRTPVPGTVGTVADMLIETVPPFDTHTQQDAIASSCFGIYVGRLGWLAANPWVNDLDLGYSMAHELGHYAFNTLDLYDLVADRGCRVSTYDISLMDNSGGFDGNRWVQTELDRPATASCPGVSTSSWSLVRQRYGSIPADNSPAGIVNTAARGNADGGALRIIVLDSAPGSSTLTNY